MFFPLVWLRTVSPSAHLTPAPQLFMLLSLTSCQVVMYRPLEVQCVSVCENVWMCVCVYLLFLSLPVWWSFSGEPDGVSDTRDRVILLTLTWRNFSCNCTCNGELQRLWITKSECVRHSVSQVIRNYAQDVISDLAFYFSWHLRQDKGFSDCWIACAQELFLGL